MTRKLLSSAAILIIVSASALAQPPGFGPRAFGPPGFGPGGQSSAGVMLLVLPEVGKELAITEAQQKSVDELIATTQDEMRSAMADFGPSELFDLGETERQQRLAQIRKRFEEIAAKGDAPLSKILSSEQSKRLAELRLQREGAAALVRPEIARQLELSADQQAKLKQLEVASRPQFGGRGGFAGPPDFDRQQRERQRTQSEMLALLSETQNSTWAALTGKPFAFAQPQFGPGGPMRQPRKLLAQFDKDGDDRLNAEERRAARATIKQSGGDGRTAGPRGGGFGRANREPAKPGPRVAQAETKQYPSADLYEPSVLRTLFLDFENDDWETELVDFHSSDVEVPATLSVDGVKYPNVGVHFRGMSSYGMVPQGYKRSLNVTLDFVDSDQRLYGYKTLNLLNCHEDPSFMSSVLYSHIARQYIPAPKANFVKVVVNGESWGVYANVQQFNKDFLSANYKTTKGTRWKVHGSPEGGGGLDYIGDKIDDYRRRYAIKSKDNDKAWHKLIELCRTLNESSAEQLPSAIEPMLDVESLLWFLALDVALINNDGYWVRASDYSIYLDPDGKFHVIPHDMNEAFHGAMMGGPGGGPGGRPGGRAGGGPPGPGQPNDRNDSDRRPGGQQGREGLPGAGPRGGGVNLDPLVALDDPRKPLRYKILAVPEYRARYLAHVRTIADQSLDWTTLGPVVAQYRALLADEVRADTRKLESFEAFATVTADEPPPSAAGRGREFPLRKFADERRAYLLGHPEIKQAMP